jgi:hypothetical protein
VSAEPRILNGELWEVGGSVDRKSGRLAARPSPSLCPCRLVPLLAPQTETNHLGHHCDHHGHHHHWKAFSSLCRLYSFPSLIPMAMAFTCLHSSGDILTTPGAFKTLSGSHRREPAEDAKTPSASQSVTRPVWALGPIYNDKYSFHLAIRSLYSEQTFHLILGIPV